jgi:hypothetical protein
MIGLQYFSLGLLITIDCAKMSGPTRNQMGTYNTVVRAIILILISFFLPVGRTA